MQKNGIYKPENFVSYYLVQLLNSIENAIAIPTARKLY